MIDAESLPRPGLVFSALERFHDGVALQPRVSGEVTTMSTDQVPVSVRVAEAQQRAEDRLRHQRDVLRPVLPHEDQYDRSKG